MLKVRIRRLPGDLVFQPDFARRGEGFGNIERCGRDIYRIGSIGALIGQRRSACPAKRPDHAWRRREPHRFAFDEREISAPDHDVCDRGRAGGKSARSAVAKALGKGSAGDPVTNRSTKATTLYIAARHVEMLSATATFLQVQSARRSPRRDAIQSVVASRVTGTTPVAPAYSWHQGRFRSTR